MTARIALLLLLPALAIFSLSQRRRLTAVMGMGLFSLVLAATYLFSHAPDVAITETAIGAALVTFTYVLAIRKTGRLVVVCDEVPRLISREGESIVGLEEEILAGFARELGLDLVIRIVPRDDVSAALKRGEADVGAGGIIREVRDRAELITAGFLPSALYRVSREGSRDPKQRKREEYFEETLEAIRENRPLSVTLDLARFLAASRLNPSGYTVERVEGEFSYGFLVSPDQPKLLTQLNAYLEHLSSSGEMERIIGRHLS